MTKEKWNNNEQYLKMICGKGGANIGKWI